MRLVDVALEKYKFKRYIEHNKVIELVPWDTIIDWFYEHDEDFKSNCRLVGNSNAISRYH